MKGPLVDEKFDAEKHMQAKPPAYYLDLWKWFSDDTAKVKDKMWTIAAWLYTLLAGLLGFIGKHITGDVRTVSINQPILIAIVSFLGIILSIYGMYMISQYGKHIRVGWNRADYIKRRIEGLNEIWYLGDHSGIACDHERDGKETTTLPAVASRLVALAGFFTLLFLVVLIVSLMSF